MARRPQGQQCPLDVVEVVVARIATGEEEETRSVLRSAQELGQKGGQARARKLTAAQRQAITRQGAAACRTVKNDRP